MTENSLNQLITLRQTAAELLASAAVDLFPGVLLSFGAGTDNLFFYDFVFPFAFKQDMLPLLEERMRLVVKQRPLIKQLDMMPGNAASLMRHHKQYIITDALKKTRLGTVQMIQIGEFTDWCESSFSQEWNFAAQFKLFQFYSIEREEGLVTRVIGTLFLEKDALKAIIKNAPEFKDCGHLALNQKLHLWVPIAGGSLWSWAPMGQAVLERLLKWWRKELKSQDFQFVTTPSVLMGDKGGTDLALRDAHTEIFLKTARASRLAEVSYVLGSGDCDAKNGLLETKGWVTDRAHFFCPEEELLQHCISSLQFIIKIPKILGFKFQIVLYSSQGGSFGGTQKKNLKGVQLLEQALQQDGLDYLIGINPQLQRAAAIVVRLSDSLGRWWDGPFLRIDDSKKLKEGYSLLERSSFGSIERFIALFLELKGGDLASLLKLNGSKDSELEN